MDMIEITRERTREKMPSPVNFEWAEDGFLGGSSQGDVLEPVPFTEGNEGSLESDEPIDFPGTQNDRDGPDISYEPESLKRRVDVAPVTSRRKKKPKGMPKRPLSAYNLYFQSERAKILASSDNGEGAKIGFEGLGKIIGKKWRELTQTERKVYEKLAEKDSIRYRKEMDAYNDMKTKKMDEEDKISSATFKASTSIDHGAMQTPPYETPVSFHAAQQNSSIPLGLSNLPAVQRQEDFSHIQPLRSNSPPAQSTAPSFPLGASDMARGQSPSQFDGGMPYPQRLPPHSRFHSSHQISCPPPPPGVAPMNPDNGIPMPPGMEIVLSDRSGKDRKYRVQYTCYSMTRDAAQQYIESITGASVDGNPPSLTPHATSGSYTASWNGF